MGEIVTRPWGSFETLHTGPDCQVKRLVINPGQRISLQSHQHRDEHWVFVSGIAMVELHAPGPKVMDLVYTPDHGNYRMIPKGWKHRVTAVGDKHVIIIETQIGTSFAETDIKRYEDDYGRIA